MAIATFAAGCFWGVEEAFRRLEGVTDTAVGYTGGETENPTYEQVCSGRTGHAEAVRVEYDPDRIIYEQLVRVFFENHDPTTRNRQGPDVGTQYRSAIFYHDDAQQQTAEHVRQELEQAGRYRGPIVTELAPARPFYLAEDYHQQYLAKRGMPGCHL